MFILDIETKGDKHLLETFLENIQAPKTYKDPEKIEEYIEKKKLEAAKEMAVDPDFCEIICIGVKEMGKKPVVFRDIESFTKWLVEPKKDKTGQQYDHLHQKMITFNGSAFDCVVLIKAAIKAGLKDFPYAHFRMAMDKYKGKQMHIDLMQELSMVWGNYKSLDKYMQIYLGTKKKPIDFETATDDEIIEHNLVDLESTELLYKKFEPLFV